MEKKIGITVVACVLGLGVLSRNSEVHKDNQSITMVQEEKSATDFSDEQMISTDSELNEQSESETEAEAVTKAVTEIENESETEAENEVITEVESELETEAENEPETEASIETNKQVDLIGSYVITDVDHYVNVRSEPSTNGNVVGKIYDDAVAEVIAVTGENGDWFQITSGNVEGYVKSEFFLYGEAAEKVLDQYVISYAKINTDILNVREKASTDSAKIGQLKNGEKTKLLENCGEWIKVQYTEQKIGYVSAEFIEIVEEFSNAKTLEEDKAEALARQQSDNSQIIPSMTGVFPDTSYTSNAELRANIVNYALQYVGNKYINGGSSLLGGTDCSGFTCFIYKDFGYSISRIPQGQFTGAGRSIGYSEIQPGDIICYSSNGGKSCTHVALYIGNGQIVHSANSRKGVITQAADYDTIIGIRNVID